MPVDYDNIKEGIGDALRRVSSELGITGTNPTRSAAWVYSLGERSKKRYTGESDCVFWRGHDDNREEFRLNKLLFNIAVHLVSTTESVTRGKRLPLIDRRYWQVESELSQDSSREIVIDMSKLVLGLSKTSCLSRHRRMTNGRKVFFVYVPIFTRTAKKTTIYASFPIQKTDPTESMNLWSISGQAVPGIDCSSMVEIPSLEPQCHPRFWTDRSPWRLLQSESPRADNITSQLVREACPSGAHA